MKNILILFFFSLSSISFAASKLNYETIVKLSDYQGQTYFSLMQEVIKPSLDQYAAEGFHLVSGKTAIEALKKVDAKVSAKALRAAGSVEKLRAVVDAVATENSAITFYELPAALAKAGVGSGRYDLTTYLALVSGGGVAVKIDSNNTAYNVNYGSGENEKDEMTGRSFGEAPGRLALDASDKHYLEILENYVRSEDENVAYFYQSILDILLNNDTSNYSSITPEGQAVATDFLAVYTAEQNRHLMSDLKRHPWDESLLEVTLLSALHSGQEKIMMMFNGEFTTTTLKQASGCKADERASKNASLVDYWQFSSSTDPANCNRSGLNVTRKDFRKLGAAITAYQRAYHPELVFNVERHFSRTKTKNNLFAQFSEFLINYKTPSQLDATTLELAADMTEFLMQVREDADMISMFIVSEFNKQ
jgi:hypothetical protein